MSAQAQDTYAAQTAAPQKLSNELADLRPEIEKVLPAHVTPDKFMRVVMTAIAQNPDLRQADRRTLLTSAVKAAQDGLLPDGREAAFVIFNTKQKVIENGRQVDRWGKAVQYMPMVAGILKKVRNSGELKSIMSNVVYEADEFNYWVDDAGEHVTHKPNVLVEDRGKLRAVYAIAKTKDGGVYVEVMGRSQIEQVRNASRAKDAGPWRDWYDEMSRKTVIRRLSKRLPMSTDLEGVIRRDDELYDLDNARTAPGARSGLSAAKELLGLPMLPDAPPGDGTPPKCDGNHAGPPCGDAECWALPEDPRGVIDRETGELKVDGGEAREKVERPVIDVAKTEKDLRAAKSIQKLNAVWIRVEAAYEGQEIPLELDAAYRETKESIAGENL